MMRMGAAADAARVDAYTEPDGDNYDGLFQADVDCQ